MSAADDWELRIAELWAKFDEVEPAEFVRRIDTLAAERPDGDGAALFERASARDSTGVEGEAEGLYRAALATEQLDPLRYSRTILQLASTLRILGRLDESQALAEEALARSLREPDTYQLADETRATLALTYVAQGRAAEAAGHALIALAPHLSRYQRSVRGNAMELIEHGAFLPWDGE
jgi:tetratricopeptide (TPR) repeat protein